MIVVTWDAFLIYFLLTVIATVVITRAVMKNNHWYSKAKRFMNVWFE
ncbi:hypothetical protein [Companilactobacillus sp.]|nr:hypothetical protein [Companilactobacillus sp.]